jgi:hypothetical protein
MIRPPLELKLPLLVSKGQMMIARLPSHLPEHPSAGIGTLTVIWISAVSVFKKPKKHPNHRQVAEVS